MGCLVLVLADTDTRLAELRSDALTPVLFIRLGFSDPVWITDASYDIEVADKAGTSRTWESGYIASISPPGGQRDSKRDAYQLGLIDSDPSRSSSFYRMFSARPTGVSLDVLTRFARSDGALTAILDVYHGQSTSVAIEAGVEGLYITQVTFTGELVNVDQEASVLTSDADQRRRSATDDSLKFAHRALDIKWGKR